jgi:hypothetical protein
MDNMHMLASVQQASIEQERMIRLDHTGSECLCGQATCSQRSYVSRIRNSLQDGGSTSFVVSVGFNSDTRLSFQLGFHS